MLTRRLAVKLLGLCVAAIHSNARAQLDFKTPNEPLEFRLYLDRIKYISVYFKGKTRRFGREEIWEALKEG